MKLLKDILFGVRITEVHGSTHVAIDNIVFDSRKVRSGSLFVATKGTTVDGHQFIDKSIATGADAVICEELPEKRDDKITYVKVADSAAALGIMASNFYDNPSEQIKLVGITGTNGKTTTATLLYHLFKRLGFRTGLLSTVVNKIHNEDVLATHTTPNAIELNALLREMADKGCTYCFMEVSSHAVHQKRISGLHFTGGLFTNITHDHLDYHKTFDEYIKAKKGFFDMLPSGSFALINTDDQHAAVMVQNTKAGVKSFGLKSMADFKGRIIENHLSGLFLNIDGKEVWTKLIGSFNAYNVLGVYAIARLLGQEEVTILTTLSTLLPVEGRFQYTKSSDNIIAVVDYAHTPDALKNVLETIKDIRTGNEQVITVVGCGGDRDKAKRPLMASIACTLSDKVILTSDNPRSEDPETIISEMMKGVEPLHFKKVMHITNRKEAIRAACGFAKSGDIILVAGKGHEKYQEIKGERFPFDDMKEVEECFKTVGK
ncbi:MAG: UDP-N-acetylmuramoyl-L-alanyl-D-glutamate--2,6-diaminopimelate ligase [Bacteroidota bacterium]